MARFLCVGVLLCSEGVSSTYLVSGVAPLTILEIERVGPHAVQAAHGGFIILESGRSVTASGL